MAGPDYIVDISGLGGPQPPDSGRDAPGPRGRPWLAVYWRCCHAYARVYRDRTGSAYTGRCPRCARHVRIPIGPGGTNARFFEAG